MNPDTHRKQLKANFNNTSTTERTKASKNIATKIIQSKIFINSKKIACYIPIGKEIDTKTIIEAIWNQNKTCYLPVINLKKEKELCFVKFQPSDKLISPHNKFLEPKIINENIISQKDLDLVIVPLLGFNNSNFRLGQGLGYYDRTFAFKKILPKSKPYLIGIGYKWQLVNFKSNDWDIPMDDIIY